MPQTKTNYREAIAKLLEETTLVTPQQIAEALIDEVDPSEHLDMLRDALPLLVRDAIQEHRSRRAPKPTQTPGISRKVLAARSIFRARYSGVDGMKFLSDFTADDVRAAIAANQAQAEALAAKNERWAALLKEMQLRAVDRVGELDEERVVEILQD